MKLAQLITLSFLTFLVPLSAARANPQYTVTKLPQAFSPTAINSSGQIAGFSSGDPQQVLLYSNGTLTDLGHLPSQDPQHALNEAFGINSSGEVVGYSNATLSPVSHINDAALFSNGSVTDLSVLLPYNQSDRRGSEARAINDAGQIVVNGNNDPRFSLEHAFLYSGGMMTDLGTLPTGFISHGTAINAGGQIVGVADLVVGGAFHNHPFLYTNGTMTDLGFDGVANAINASGQIVGNSNNHAFLYSNGTMTDLGTLDGFNSTAAGINASGQIVGDTALNLFPGSFPVGYVYSNGTMTNLNNLIVPGSSFTIASAVGINDAGQILASGFDGPAFATFLLNPVPEPSSVVLAALGFLGLVAWGWRSTTRKMQEQR